MCSSFSLMCISSQIIVFKTKVLSLFPKRVTSTLISSLDNLSRDSSRAFEF